MTLERVTKAPEKGEIYYDYINNRDLQVVDIDQEDGKALCKLSEYETIPDGEIILKDWKYVILDIKYIEMIKRRWA